MKKVCLILLGLCLARPAFTQKNYRLEENIPYRTTGDPYTLERCKLDVYYPESEKDRPVVVWFHGGGLSGGEKFIPDELKNYSMVVVAVNYRLLPKATLHDCIEDAAASVAWTFGQIEK